MIIKSFTADSVAAALKDVRAELGGDAVVLNTRQLTDAGSAGKVEITVCLDTPAMAGESVSLPVVDRAEIIQEATTEAAELTLPDNPIVNVALTPEAGEQNPDSTDLWRRLSAIETELRALGDIGSIYQNSRKLPETLRAVRASLLAADLPDSDVTDICRAALSGTTHVSNIRQAVRTELQKRLSTYIASEFSLNPGQSVLFVGPPGAGKTTVMGKLAARLIVREQTKVRFISLGSTKVGAVDELQSFADILGGDMLTPGDINQYEIAPDSVSLLDSPAISSIPDPDSELLLAVERIRPIYRVIVFSALTRAADLPALAETLMSFSPTHLAMTMTDLTSSWGTALTLCKLTGVKLALVNDAPSGVGSLSSPKVNQILNQLLGESEIDHA